MENKTKIIGLIILILLIIASTYFVYQQGLTAQVIESRHTYTKAICDENNFCQDYEVVCLNKKVISLQPISGATIQHKSNWEDPRKNKSEIICE